MPLNLIIDIGVMVLILAGIALCIVVIALVTRLTPPLLRSARHLEKISEDTATVSEDVAHDIAKTARNAAIASESAVSTLGHLEKISGDTAAVSEAVARDIAKTARNAAIASENAVAALENVNKISGDAAAASEDVTTDVAKTARYAAICVRKRCRSLPQYGRRKQRGRPCGCSCGSNREHGYPRYPDPSGCGQR